MLKPNFTSVRIDGDEVVVAGRSATDPKTGVDADELEQITGITVFLIQGDRFEHRSVEKVSDEWKARFDVAAADGSSPDFQRDDVITAGVERRREDVSVHWAQDNLKIE